MVPNILGKRAWYPIVLALGIAGTAEALSIRRCDPPNWWAGMRYRELQLMFYGSGLRNVQVSCKHAGVRVRRVYEVPSGNYAFVDVELAEDLSAGTYTLEVRTTTTTKQWPFQVLARDIVGPRHQGFDSRDSIYLITPDRFSNGDPTNDRVEGILDDHDPAQAEKRHGGDLQGIIDHLDFIAELGCTAIWLNPVLENNGHSSYHGYKATDLYRIDPRFGSNALYREFVQKAHARGLKVIFDHVSNHIGIRHPWLRDLPTQDWLNGSVENHWSHKHFLLSLTDPHADPLSRRQLQSFWFVDEMPDLNQRNPHLAKYLIQNSLWWIEFAGLDGIREDTYPYADQEFLSRWAGTIREEYPRFNIVGEVWATHPGVIAQFQTGSKFERPFDSNLPSLMDFPLMDALRDFVEDKGKLRDVYEVYAQDFLYADPDRLVVFLENHDTPRACFLADDQFDRVHVALTLLLMGRGIPQLLYGSEIQMVGGQRHVDLRADFPGGFPHSDRNAFIAAGRTPAENAMHRLVKRLLAIRRKYPSVAGGTMTQYPPTWNRDVFAFVRRRGEECVVVLANGDSESRTVTTEELRQMTGGRSALHDLLTEATHDTAEALELPPVTARVLLAPSP